jgi:hypothetical protein
MYKENLITPALTDANALTGAKTERKPCYYNILTFSHSEKQPKICFTTKEDKNKHRFRVEQLPEAARAKFTINRQTASFVYTNFDETGEGIALNINLKKHPAISRAYYTKLIRDYLSPAADVVIPNFLNDTQFWFKSNNHQAEGYTVYKKFTLRVQTNNTSGTPELLISFEGCSRVSSKNLLKIEDRHGFREKIVRKVIYGKKLYDYDKRPDVVKHNAAKAFPLLNRELIGFLNVYIPANLNREKHKEFFEEVKWFYNTHLKDKQFRRIILHSGVLRKVEEHDRFILENTKTELVFGNDNKAESIHNGFKQYGPAKLPPCSVINYFFVYDQHNPDGMNALQNCFINTCNNENRLRAYVKLPVVHRPELDIAFDSKNDILQQIRQRIRTMQLTPGRCYYAFFINPFTKWECNIQNWKLYHRVKEALLQRDIMMQNMESRKIMNGSLHFFLPNLAAAMTGKLGGIPWKLESTGEDELVIGFGLSRTKKLKTAWIGSAFCFKNDGTFQQFDSFRADESERLAAKVEEALLKYRESNKEAKRIIIHFYRKLGRKTLMPIEKMLKNLKVNIPVIIVSINKNRSNNLAVTFKDNSGGLPLNGEYFRTAGHQYLLYINDRDSYGDQMLPNMPMPLKINLWCSNQEEINDQATVRRIFQQVHDFCFVYWRSVKHAKLPVTIAYPEMVADILPWFDYKVLDGEAEQKMWFL